VQLPAEYIPESPNEVADSEDYKNHSKDSSDVAEHDLSHDVVVIGEGHRLSMVSLDDPLELAIVVGLDQLSELLRLDQHEQPWQSKELEELNHLLNFMTLEEVSEGNDREEIEDKGRFEVPNGDLLDVPHWEVVLLADVL
jgi:hypothetical protein